MCALFRVMILAHTARPHSVPPVLKFVEMGEVLAIPPNTPQRLMPMWDVKVALVFMPVQEPQVALGMLVTQGARVVQAVSGRGLVSILVTTLLQHPLIPRREGPLDHPHALVWELAIKHMVQLVMSRVLILRHVFFSLVQLEMTVGKSHMPN